MADPLSITASIVGITAAGVQVSISLFALAETVSTASERVSSVANDISSTCGILNQLRDLITPQPGFISTHNTSIFNPTALSDIHSALHHCRSIFSQIKKFLERATKQVKDRTPRPHLKITLSRSEKAKWPFLQAAMQDLRNDLRDSKTNLLLMVAVANLAMAQRRRSSRGNNSEEQADLRATIVKLQRMKTLDLEESDDESEEEKENLFQRLMQKLGLRKAVRKEEESEDDIEEDRAANSRGLAPTGTRNVPLSEKAPEQNQTADAAAAAAASVPPQQSDSRASHLEQSDDPAVDDESIQSAQTHSEQPKDKVGTGVVVVDESPIPSIKPVQSVKSGNKDDVLHVADLNESVGHKIANQRSNREALFVDVAVQTLAEAEGDIRQDQLPFIAPAGMNTSARMEGGGQFIDTKFPDESINIQEGSNAQKVSGTAPSSLGEPTPINGQKPSSIGSNAGNQECLQAWIFSILPGLTSGQGSSLGVMEVNLSDTEIRALILKQEAQDSGPIDILNQLNTYQRRAVLEHTQQEKSKLLFVDIWHRESIATVFGLIEVVTLMWVTASAKRREGHVEAKALFEEKTGNLKGKAKVNSTSNLQPDPSGEEEPLYFKDAVGRKFVFPFQLVKSWKGMEELVKQAFLHVDVIGPHVQEGHYDLVDANGKIILPQTWTYLVQPGWEIVMHMWPMPEPRASRPRPQPPPPPPPAPMAMPPGFQGMQNGQSGPKLDSHLRPMPGAFPAQAPPPRPGAAGIPPPPPPPPADIYVPPLDHGYLRHSIDGKANDMSVLKWMAGMAGPGLGKPKKRVRREEDVVVPYRVVNRGKGAAKGEDRIVDDLLLKWTV